MSKVKKSKSKSKSKSVKRRKALQAVQNEPIRFTIVKGMSSNGLSEWESAQGTESWFGLDRAQPAKILSFDPLPKPVWWRRWLAIPVRGVANLLLWVSFRLEDLADSIEAR